MNRKSIPVLASSRNLSTLFDVLKNPSAFLLKLSCSAKDIGELKAGPVHIICVNRPEWVHSILVQQTIAFGKMPAVKTLKVFTGDGLLVSDGATWAKHRRLAAPAFHHHRVAGYGAIAVQAARETVSRWRDGEILNLESEMKRLTLTIIGRTLFTQDVNDVAAGLSRDIDTALNYVNGLSGRIALPFIHSLARRDREALAAIERVDAAVRNLIRQRREQSSEQVRADGRNDLLSMLLSARTAEGESLTDDEVRDEVITMFVAGHETVATVLTWLFYLVAHAPQVQSALKREAGEVIGSGELTYDMLARLPYTLQVYKEAMRLYPGGFTIGRQALRDVYIGNYVIPAGAWVMISPYSVHRHPDIFADPEQFDPGRFTAENEGQLPRGSFIPFGIGPRVCIGGQFALMEGQVIVSTFARHVRLVNVTRGEVVVSPLVTLRPSRKIEMRVERLR